MSNVTFIQALPGSTVFVGGEHITDEYDVVLDDESVSLDFMTDTQRRTLFALWNEAFGRDCSQEDRHAFTSAVLGKNVDPSWARDGDLTGEQALHLGRVLAAVASLI